MCPQDKKTLQELQPHEKLRHNESKAIHINETGLRRLITKCQKQMTEIADHFGITEESRYMRKEIEII